MVYRLPTWTLLLGVEVMLLSLHPSVGTGHQGCEALHPAPTCVHLVMEVEMISTLRGYVKSVIDSSETGVREQKVVIDLILEQLESSLFREQSADITMNFIPRFCGGIHASRCFVGDVPAKDSFDITSPLVRSQPVRNERWTNLTSLHPHRLSRVCHLAVHLVQTCLVPLPNRPNPSPRSK